MHRGDLYEDVLEELFVRERLGSTVTGGGSELGPESEVLSCDIEVDLVDDSEAGLLRIVAALEGAGAPRGSWLQQDGGNRVAFGFNDGIVLTLPGPHPIDVLYEHVPGNEAIMALMLKLSDELGDAGMIQSWFIGETESRIFFYGPSGDQLREKILIAVEDDELARGSRVSAIG